MRTTCGTSSTWAVLVAAAAWLLPSAAMAVPPAACGVSTIAPGDAACGMSAMLAANKAFNPPSGEDGSFVNQAPSGARTSVAIVLDTSDYMRQLPVPMTPGTGGVNGCSNLAVNAQLYWVNKCINPLGVPVAPGDCPAVGTLNQGVPVKWKLTFDPSYPYPQADDLTPNLFVDGKYYHLDEGWSADTTTVNPSFVWTTDVDACVGAASTANCAACLGTAGYYIPPAGGGSVVLSGRFLNFLPPRYVLARKVVRETFQRLDANGKSRQALFTVARGAGDGDDAMRCFGPTTAGAYAPGINTVAPLAPATTWTDGSPKGLDSIYDGARIESGFFPTCASINACSWDGTGARATPIATLLGNTPTNLQKFLFRGPMSALGGAAPSVGNVAWSQQADGLWKGRFGPAFAPTSLNGASVTCAPYGEALYGVAEYFSEVNTVDPLFKKTAPPAQSLEVGDAVCTSAQCGCPNLATIVIAGGAPLFDDNIPADVMNANGAVSSPFAKVADYFAHQFPGGLRPAGFPNLRMRTYVIGLGTESAALQEAARVGGGRFINAPNAQALKSALAGIVNNVQTDKAAFSNTAVTAVQSRSGSSILVPRFVPTSEALWDGHLLKYLLVSEDACGCVGGASDPCDFNQDQACGGVYLKDKDGDFIVETTDGVFVKATLDLATHQFKSTCTDCNAVPIWDAAQQITSQINSSAAQRKIYTVLDQDAAGNADGNFDSHDKVVEFTEANAALLAPYLGTTNNPVCTTIANRVHQCLTPTDCAGYIIRFVRGEDIYNADPALVHKARSIVLGDIFHSAPVVVDPPLPGEGVLCRNGLHNQCIRSLTKTPTVLTDYSGVNAYEKFRVETGTLPAVTASPTPVPADDVGALSREHRPRIALVGANDGMVHAFHNGSWHDCSSGSVDKPSACVSGIGFYDRGTGDELWAFIPPDQLSKLPDLLGTEHQYFVDATPMVREVWADANGDHTKDKGEFHTVAVIGERRGGKQFFALDVTDTRGPTIAAGGTAGFFRWLYPQFFTSEYMAAGYSYSEFLPSPPPIGPIRVKSATGTLAWTFPATTCAVDADCPSGQTCTAPNCGPNTPVTYDERWIVALNGGLDTALISGRSVSLVDVWNGGDGSSSVHPYKFFGPSCDLTGDLLAASTGGVSPSVPATLAAKSPTIFQFPVVSTVAMVGWGTTETNLKMSQNDYFFDTAVVGDMGGQVFTLRFGNPDPLTWAGARNLSTSNTTNPGDRQPFFQIPSLVFTSPAGELRAALGSGDRYALRDASMGACSETNLLGCLRRGCQVQVQQEMENFPCQAGEVQSSMTLNPLGQGANTLSGCGPDLAVPMTAANACNRMATIGGLEFKREIELENCPAAMRPAGVTEFETEPQVNCTVGPVANAGATCVAVAGAPTAVTCTGANTENNFASMLNAGSALAADTATPGSTGFAPRSGFFAPLIFSRSPPARAPTAFVGARSLPAFSDAAGAALYDHGRWQTCPYPLASCSSDLKNTDPYAAPQVGALASNPGWYFLYGQSPSGATHAGIGFNSINERTATPSTVIGGCTLWSTMTPAQAPSACGRSDSSAASMYRLKLVEGTACIDDNLSAQLGQTSIVELKTVVPPPAPQISVFLSPSGTMSVSIVDLPRQGGRNVSATSVAVDTDLVKTIHEVALPRTVEACRHSTSATASTNCGPMK